MFSSFDKWSERYQSAPRNRHLKSSPYYLELRDVLHDEGFRREELIRFDYPFTPDYVNSFAGSADYHNDPVGAINNAPKRENLGDIRGIQSAMHLDTDGVHGVRSRIMTAVAHDLRSKQKLAPAEPQSVANGGENK